MPVSIEELSDNRLLGSFSAKDLARLKPHLKKLNLKLKQNLEWPNKPIEHVYFLSAGIASVVAVQSDGTQVEIGLIGREGMTGSAILLGNDRSPHSTYIQVEGRGWRIATKDFHRILAGSKSLQTAMLRYVQTFMVQTAHTATANARAKLPQRLARWILMAQDRVGGNEVTLTHEFLSLMLAVRRAGVTETLQALRKAQLISSRPGKITVINRGGLLKTAGDFYGVPEQEYQRLIGR